MAVSNAVGSNVFDILLCMGLPWFLKTTLVTPGQPIQVFSAGMQLQHVSLLLYCLENKGHMLKYFPIKNKILFGARFPFTLCNFETPHEMGIFFSFTACQETPCQDMPTIWYSAHPPLVVVKDNPLLNKYRDQQWILKCQNDVISSLQLINEYLCNNVILQQVIS